MVIESSSVPQSVVPPGTITVVEGLELLRGMNDIPLLYIGARQQYVRLSPLGFEVVQILLNASAPLSVADLEQVLQASYPGRGEEIHRKLADFLAQLHRSGGIILPEVPPADALPDRVIRTVARRPMLRLALWRPQLPPAYRLVQHCRKLSGDVFQTLIALWLMLAAFTAGMAAVRLGTNLAGGAINWLIVMALFALHLVLHEMSHTLVSSYYGVRVRELGIALLYYIFPVAYTDRTDAYRLRDPRQRIRISLAGPAFDISGASISGLLALTTTGWLSATAHALSLIQLLTFFSNLNPLMPSDGYHALEAAFGELNFRQRTFFLLWHCITLRPLPAYLRDIAPRQKWFYLCYALLMLGYILMLATLLLTLVSNLVVRRWI